jgi:hypothetical protein
MNEARPFDRDAAAALIEPLTDIVIRAGAAILAVNRSAMKVDGKTDGSPVTEADLAADRAGGLTAERLGTARGKATLRSRWRSCSTPASSRSCRRPLKTREWPRQPGPWR